MPIPLQYGAGDHEIVREERLGEGFEEPVEGGWHGEDDPRLVQHRAHFNYIFVGVLPQARWPQDIDSREMNQGRAEAKQRKHMLAELGSDMLMQIGCVEGPIQNDCCEDAFLVRPMRSKTDRRRPIVAKLFLLVQTDARQDCDVIGLASSEE